MRNIKQTTGMKSAFSMMELIFYIVIIGILASVAMPSLVSVQDDAKISNEKSTIGAIRSAVGMLHGKAVIKNGDFRIKTIDTTDTTSEKVTVVAVTKANYPVSLSADNQTDAIVPEVANALTNSSETLGLVLELDGRTDWVTSQTYATTADAGSLGTASIVRQYIAGPATRLSGVIDDLDVDEFEYDNAGAWIYDAITGAITYDNDLTVASGDAITVASATAPTGTATGTAYTAADSCFDASGALLSPQPADETACTSVTGQTWALSVSQ